MALRKAMGSLLETEPMSVDGCPSGGPQNNHQDLENGHAYRATEESMNPLCPDSENTSVSPESTARDYTRSHLRFFLTVMEIFAKVTRRDCIFSLVGFLIGLIVMGIAFVIYTQKGPSGKVQGATSSPPVVTSTPPFPWKMNGTWQYLFSEREATWNESQRICASHGASLVTLDTPEEKAFIEDARILQDSWLDLWRESPGEPWRYSNGTAFEDRSNSCNSSTTFFFFSKKACKRNIWPFFPLPLPRCDVSIPDSEWH